MKINDVKKYLEEDKILRAEAISRGGDWYVHFVTSMDSNIPVTEEYLETEKGAIRSFRSLDSVNTFMRKFSFPDYWVRIF